LYNKKIKDVLRPFSLQQREFYNEKKQRGHHAF